MNFNEALKQIKQLGTNGCNYEVSNEDIINKVEEWNRTLDIEILEVSYDSVTIHFKSLPVETKKFAEEIYTFCPDVVDQHFGLFGEIFEGMNESGSEISEEMLNLLEGVDFTDDNYGLVLLEKALTTNGIVQLWWD